MRSKLANLLVVIIILSLLTQTPINTHAQTITKQQTFITLWEKDLSGPVLSVAWSPDGTKLAIGTISGHHGRVFVFSKDGNLLWQSEDLGGSVLSVAWSPDGTKLAAGTSGGDSEKVVVLDSEGNLLWQSEDLGEDVWSVAWSPDGTKLAIGTILRVMVLEYNGNTLWQSEITGLAMSVAWSPDGERLAAGIVNGIIIVFDKNGIELWSKGYATSISSVAWSPDGTKLAAGTSGGDSEKVVVLDSEGNLLWQSEDLGGWVESVAWDKNGYKIVAGVGADCTCGGYGKVVVLDSEGNLLWQSEDLGGWVESVAWDKNGYKIVAGVGADCTCGGYGKVVVLDSEGNLLWQSEDLGDSVLSVAWSPDGERLAAGTMSNRVFVFGIVNSINGKNNILVYYPDKIIIPSNSGIVPVYIYNSGNSTIYYCISVNTRNSGDVWGGLYEYGNLSSLNGKDINAFDYIGLASNQVCSIIKPGETKMYILYVILENYNSDTIAEGRDETIQIALGDGSSNIYTYNIDVGFFYNYNYYIVYKYNNITEEDAYILLDLVASDGFADFNYSQDNDIINYKLKIINIEGRSLTDYNPRIYAYNFRNNVNYFEEYGAYTSKARLRNIIIAGSLLPVYPSFLPPVFQLYSLNILTYESAVYGGACFGMVYSSMLAYEGVFETSKPLSSLNINETIKVNVDSESVDIRTIDLIALAQWFAPVYLPLPLLGNTNPMEPSAVISKLEDAFQNNMVAEIDLISPNGGGAHSVLAYGMYYDDSSDKYVVLIYDPNYGNPATISGGSVLYIDPSSDAVYYNVLGKFYVVAVRTVNDLRLSSDQLLSVLRSLYPHILILIDPVDKYDIYDANDNPIVLRENVNLIKGIDYDIIVLNETSTFKMKLVGSDYNVSIASIDSDNKISYIGIYKNSRNRTQDIIIFNDNTKEVVIRSNISNNINIKIDIIDISNNISNTTIFNYISKPNSTLYLKWNTNEYKIRALVDVNSDGVKDFEINVENGTTLNVSSLQTTETQSSSNSPQTSIQPTLTTPEASKGGTTASTGQQHNGQALLYAGIVAVVIIAVALVILLRRH